MTGNLVRVEHWGVAQNHGRTTGLNIVNHLSNKPLVPFTSIPYFWTAQHGKGLRYCGHATAYDEVIIKVKKDKRKEFY